MPLKSLIIIIARIYAIYWVIDGLSVLLSVFPILLAYEKQLQSASMPFPAKMPYLMVVIQIATISTGVLLWFLSGWIAARVTKGYDTRIEFSGLTRADLYQAAFVFLGLHFALSSVSALILSAYDFFVRDFSLPANNPSRGHYLWPFLSHAVTFVAGLTCLFGTERWTRKLMRIQDREKAASPTGER